MAENDRSGAWDENTQKPQREESPSVSLIRWLVIRRICTRRTDASQLIRSGVVAINAVVCLRLGTPIRTIDTVSVNGQPILDEEEATHKEHTHYLLYKPRGCLCTRRSVLLTADGASHRPDPRSTVYDYIPTAFHHLHAIGRLDYDTTGILLFTTDGSLTHRLATPAHAVPKVYRCTLRGDRQIVYGRRASAASSKEDTTHDGGSTRKQQTLSDTAIQRLAHGVVLPNGRRVTGTAWNVAVTERDAATTTAAAAIIDLQIHGGSNHQVKHMMGIVGRPIVHLHRRTFAGVELPDRLEIGQGRLLTAEETARLYAIRIPTKQKKQQQQLCVPSAAEEEG